MLAIFEGLAPIDIVEDEPSGSDSRTSQNLFSSLRWKTGKLVC
jgi:hypothetical protein